MDRNLLSSKVKKGSFAKSIDENEEVNFLEARSQSRTIARIKAGMGSNTTMNPFRSKHNLSELLEDEYGNTFRHTTPPPIQRQPSQRITPNTEALATTRSRRNATRVASSRGDSLVKDPYVSISSA